MSNIGFIGAGNMGYAMLKGALSSISPENVGVTDRSFDKAESIAPGNRSAVILSQMQTA